VISRKQSFFKVHENDELKMKNFIPLRNLLGKVVHDLSGAPVGAMQELLLDIADGRVTYVEIALDLDGTLDNERPGSSLTVPWSALQRKSASSASAEWRIAAGRATLERLAEQQRKVKTRR